MRRQVDSKELEHPFMSLPLNDIWSPKMQYSLYGVSRWSCLSSRRLFSEPLSARLPPSDLIPGDIDTMCTVKQNL